MQLVLVGQPVAQSRSAAMFEAAARVRGLDLTYTAHDVVAATLPDFVEKLRAGIVGGVNITVPHKVAALSLADVATSVAEDAGCANVWYLRDGKVVAQNTDVVGVHGSLDALAVPPGTTAWLIGAGGAARAAGLALSRRCPRIVICSRRMEAARALAADLVSAPTAGDVVVSVRAWPRRAVDARLLAEDLVDVGVVVQTTSFAGTLDDPMWRHMPWAAVRPEATFLDVRYGEVPTPFVARAQSAGHVAIDGATMLVLQAAGAWRHWLPGAPPVLAMRDALASALGRDPAEILVPAMANAD